MPDRALRRYEKALNHEVGKDLRLLEQIAKEGEEERRARGLPEVPMLQLEPESGEDVMEGVERSIADMAVPSSIPLYEALLDTLYEVPYSIYEVPQDMMVPLRDHPSNMEPLLSNRPCLYRDEAEAGYKEPMSLFTETSRKEVSDAKWLLGVEKEDTSIDRDEKATGVGADMGVGWGKEGGEGERHKGMVKDWERSMAVMGELATRLPATAHKLERAKAAVEFIQEKEKKRKRGTK